MSACADDQITAAKELIAKHEALVAEIRAEERRQTNDPRANLARNVAIIADILKIMLLGAIVVTAYLTWRFVL